MRLTSLNSRVFCSSGVTSLVTVLPPSLVRSLAMPASICAKVTKMVAWPLDQAGFHPNSIPYAASCRVRPVMRVILMPHLAPMTPARRLVTAPANSYSVNMMATSRAEKLRLYAWSRTIIRIAPSVTVKRRYDVDMMANGRR